MKSTLKATFQEKYSHDRFKTFLAEMFQKSASEFDFQKVFPEKDTEKYYDTRHLLSFQTDDKKTVEVLSVELQTKGNVENARGYQRGLIEKYIKNRIHQNKWVDGVLVAFWSEFDTTWRLSFVTMDLKDGKKEFSPFKRHSFLVGKHEATHTAEQQFYEVLKSKKTPLFTQLQEVFSVEKVTDDFFEEYKKHFLSLNTKFLENKVFQESVVEAQGVKNADFVKKLMGQIVFLYFLQKKGWMGVSQGDKWGSGNKNFMRDLLNECLEGGDPNKERSGENFFNDYLEHLFYDTLNNKDRGGASVAGDYSWSSYFQCRIPYLNGGLFEPVYEWKQTFIDIPNSLFEGLFDTFDRYNFTVYESDSLETDVAVDPEMLGKVFENLLEIDERKGKGAFYTPREIVHYMCQESLINYLVNSSGYEESRIRTLMERKDEVTAKSEAEKKIIEENQDLKDMALVINDLLKNVTVCDPAVGSGAFPMGMLKEIVSLRFFLNRHFVKAKHEKTGKTLNEYDIKKETLEHCIYGVDIEPGAIEICRLRFWLSMVVEHEIEEVEPLPNLDYKLMQGNSLLEDLVIGDSVIKLNIDSGIRGDKRTTEMKNLLEKEKQGALFSLDSNTEVVDKLQKLHIEFFDETDPEKKKVLKNKIDEYENLFIETACNDEINRLQSVIRNSDDKKKDKAEKQIALIEQTLNQWKKDHIRPFFPWRLHFGEIFKKGGFDIVIGNPPYIRHRDLEKKFKDNLKNIYEVGTTTADIYCYFYELSFNLLRKQGVLSFITSNKWLRAEYGKLLRQFLIERTTFRNIIDLGKGQFNTATVDTNIIIFSKINKQPDSCFLFGNKIISNNNLQSIFQKSLSEKPFCFLNEHEILLRNKVERIGRRLGEWKDIKINYGVLTGINEIKIENKKHGVFIINKEKRDDLIRQDENSDIILKPLLRGKDIYHYATKWDQRYLVAVHYGMNECISRYPAIKNHLEKYEFYLRNRAQVKRGDHHWIELDQNPSQEYMNDFRKEKIVYSELTQGSAFYWDKLGKYCVSNTAYLITGKHLGYLTAILNSSFIKYIFRKFYSIDLGSSGLRWLKVYIVNLPIPQISESEQRPFIDLVDQILEITAQEGYDPKNPPEEQKELEAKIDEMVFDLYGLTPEERDIILNS